MIYTDLEPDDIMAVSQLWHHKRDQIHGEPMVIAHWNFQDKDGGEILEKKQLLAQLMVGVSKYHELTHEGDSGTSIYKPTGRAHPRQLEIARARSLHLENIAQELEDFQGDCVDFYCLAPPHGNLAAILQRLKSRNAWPLPKCQKWKVTMYTGAFNMAGMTHSDEDALREIMAQSDTPLVDIGKFPFFGKTEAHPWCDSFTTFAAADFGEQLAKRWSIHAAMLKLFNDEFNAHLIGPEKKIWDKKGKLTADEERRFNRIKRTFDVSDPRKVRAYAKQVVADQALFDKIAGFKKSTFQAYATDSCDSPLCDQLVLLYEWLATDAPGALKDHHEAGRWVFNREKGFTQVIYGESADAETDYIPAIQPKLLDPRDEKLLGSMRDFLKVSLIEHLELLDEAVAAREPKKWTSENE
jgi:hypothetical protein